MPRLDDVLVDVGARHLPGCRLHSASLATDLVFHAWVPPYVVAGDATSMILIPRRSPNALQLVIGLPPADLPRSTGRTADTLDRALRP